MKLYMRKKRRERKHLGLCTSCGSEKPKKGYAFCEKCRARGKSYYIPVAKVAKVAKATKADKP